LRESKIDDASTRAWKTDAMRDAEWVRFLQWALPRLRMRWRGFRKVRGQVIKRIRRRIDDLSLAGLDAYRARLESDDAEWSALDACCRVTISRFLRDRAVWKRIAEELRRRGETRAWCAGCASGEEPHTLALIAREVGARISILATDADAHLLDRARTGRYRSSSLRELSDDRIAAAFVREGDESVLRPELRDGIAWRQEDLRASMPDGPFDLILCRYLAFTYFDDELQRSVLDRISRRLAPEGILVLGTHERPPSDAFEALSPCLFTRKRGGGP
jgi:chemotaxis protein methyltransferase CheR